VWQRITNNIRRVRVLHRALAISSPDVVIAFGEQTNVLTILASRGLSIPVVISDRVDPRQYTPGTAWRLLRRLVYSRSSIVVVQTERTRAFLAGCFRAKFVVIPNPIAACPTAQPEDSTEDQTVVAMGRLEHQKGFDVLLRAFATFVRLVPHWRLIIIGTGTQENELQRLAKDLDLHDNVAFVGTLQNPRVWLQRASIFALSSRFEGFPNALAEAMACGKAVVATDCPTGPRELTEDGKAGVLVPVDDVGALANAFVRLATDPELRQRLGRAARTAMEAYRPDRVIRQWEYLLHQLPQKLNQPPTSS
jgi:glycosyltransferase involved in cell wall biosynthesis